MSLSPLRTLGLILLLLVATPVCGQAPAISGSQEAETQFRRALARYIQGNYAEARQNFQQLLDTLPPNQRSSAARLMLAKSLLKLGEHSLAFAAAVELYEQFPYSRYLPEADLIIGDCNFHQGQIATAASQYARILTSKADIRLKARAANRLGQMAGVGKLTDRDVERLQADFGKSVVAEAVAFGKARWPAKLGRPEEGRQQLDLFMEQFPNGLLTPLVRRGLLARGRPAAPPRDTSEPQQLPLRQLPVDPSQARYKIGLIAPLASPLGIDLRDGVLLAREQHPLSSAEQVGLVFEDSEGDPIRAVKAAQRLIEDHNVIAIIGALNSDETIPLATQTSASRVPLVAPTASTDGIAAISPYVFQINATPGAQGRRLAEYAVGELGLGMLATLASRDTYGERIAKEFTAKAEGMGAEVIVQEWYVPGTTDYRGQFQRVRDAGLALQPPETVAAEVDSLLLGEMRVPPPPPVPVDPDTVEPEPVLALDGMLVAGGRDDVLLIAPQVAFHQINAQLLGSDGWNHQEVAEARGGYVDGAIFAAKYYDQSELPSVRSFVDAFRLRFQRDQSIAAALGYDAMRALLSAIDAGASDRESLRLKLESIAQIPGATGRITFGKGDRENAWMYMLQIRRRKIVPLTDLAVETSEPE